MARRLTQIIPWILFLIPNGSALEADTPVRLGWEAYLSGDLLSARNRFTEAIQGNPEEPFANLGLGTLEAMAGNTGKALLRYRNGFVGTVRDMKGNPMAEKRALLDAAGAYMLRRMDSLRDFRNEGPLFTQARLDRLLSEGAPLELTDSYRYFLARALIEAGRYEEADTVLVPLRIAQNILIAGPFPNVEGSGLMRRFGPEYAFEPGEAYEGKTRRVSFRRVVPRARHGRVDVTSLADPSLQSTAYLSTALFALQAGHAELGIGHAGAVRVWVGSRPVMTRDAYHPLALDQLVFPVELEAGWNLVTVKIARKEGPCELLLRVRSGEEGIRWWDADIPFPVSGPLELSEGGPVRSPDRRSALAPFSASPPLFRALALWLYGSNLRLQESLDKNEQEDLDAYREARDLFPKSPFFWTLVGSAEPDSNAGRQAWMRALELQPDAVLPRLVLAQSALASSMPVRAQRWVDEIHRLNSDCAEGWQVAGRLERQRDAGPLSHFALERAHRLAPYHSGYAREWLFSREERMTVQEKRNRLREILALNTGDDAVRKELIGLALHQGLPSEAEALLREGLLINPYAFSLAEPIVDYHRANGNPDRAEALLREGLETSPHSASLLKSLGLVLREKGQHEEARKAWREALVTRPQDAWLVEYSEYHTPEEADFHAPNRIAVEDLAVPESPPADANAVVLLDQEVRRVYENGSSSRIVHYVVHVLTETGARQNKEYPIFYTPDSERVRIRRARAIRADGTIFDAPPPTSFSAIEGGSEGGRVFGDYHYLRIDFPNVEKGVTLDLEYQVEDTGENIYADYFGDVQSIGGYDPTLLFRYVLIAPRSRPIYHQVTGIEDRMTKSGKPDGETEVYQWEYRNLPLTRQEPNMPASSESLPILRVSTFRTWDEMVNWFHHLIREQFTSSEFIRTRTREILADYVTQKAKRDPGFDETRLTDLDRVRAVNRFVNTQIRYLAFSFGIHGYKPYRAEEILRNRYGDCKDKALLAIVMLRELGVEARFALIRTRGRGSVDFTLPSLGVFDHAILELPNVDGKRLILDGTAKFFGATELPPGDQGVSILAIGLDGSWEWIESPLDPPGRNGALYETELELHPDGTATGSRRMSARGIYNLIMRYQYENRGRAGETIASSFGSEFPGTRIENIQLSDLDDPDEDEWLRFDLHVPRYARAEGENRLVFRPILMPVNAYRTYADLERRRHDLVLHGGSGYRWFRERRIKVRIPEGYSIATLPRNVTIESPFGTISTAWNHSAGDITLSSRIEWNTVRISSEDYPAFRAFCRELDEAEEARVVLTRNPAAQ